jgi:hypothetical protein
MFFLNHQDLYMSKQFIIFCKIMRKIFSNKQTIIHNIIITLLMHENMKHDSFNLCFEGMTQIYQI